MTDHKKLTKAERAEISRLVAILSSVGRSSQAEPLTNGDLWRAAELLNDYLRSAK